MSPLQTNFSAFTDISDWVGKFDKNGNLLLDPGKPTASSVYNRLKFAKDSDDSDNSMPLPAIDAPQWTEANAEIIHDFIANLEFNNYQNSSQEFANLTTDAVNNIESIKRLKMAMCGSIPSAEDIIAIDHLPELSLADNENRTIIKNLIQKWIEEDNNCWQIIRQYFSTAFMQDCEMPRRSRAFGLLKKNLSIGIRDELADHINESFQKSMRDIVINRQPFTDILTTDQHYITTTILITYLNLEESAQHVLLRDGATRVTKSGAFGQGRIKNLIEEDWNDWKKVKIVQSEEKPINYDSTDQEIRDFLKNNDSIPLNIPRSGFGNLLGFHFCNLTNEDNRFRRTANQFLIAATNRSTTQGADDLDLNDKDPSKYLDAEHTASEQDCVSCHKVIDPFASTYFYHIDEHLRLNKVYEKFKEQSENRPSILPSLITGINFYGVKKQDENIDFPQTMARFTESDVTSDIFYRGQLERVCNWLTGHKCETKNCNIYESILEEFKNHKDYITLLKELGSSPMLLGQGLTEECKGYGPITLSYHRFKNYLENIYSNLGKSNLNLRTLDGLPKAHVKRGLPGIVFDNTSSPIKTRVLEKTCQKFAKDIVANFLRGDDQLQQSIKDLVNLMVLPYHSGDHDSSWKKYFEHREKLFIDYYNSFPSDTSKKRKMSEVITLACITEGFTGI